jgi:RNA polymerase sigma-70 factor (ECF subfamily)
MPTSTKMMDHLFRQQSGKMNSILINHFGFEYSGLIEDVIQETFLAALKHWGMKGIPENPEGWLMQVAKNKIINEVNCRKRHGKLNQKYIQTSDLEILTDTLDDEIIKREQIKALFSCCSDELSTKSQIMLTLKVISGFGDKEIGKALFMKEQAVRKGIYRARSVLKESGREYLEVKEVDYKNRIETVLMVLYLMFNEGYHSTSEDSLLNADISFEAIRLTTWLLDISEVDHGNTHALLALMFFNFSRFNARTNQKHEILDIEHQDRNKWQKPFIQKGLYHLKQSRVSTQVSRYHIESGIAAVHCLSPSFNETNWSQIVTYYEKLLLIDTSIHVKINYAIALSEKGESEKGLEILKSLENQVKEKNSLLFGAMARINMNLKNIELAKSYYKVALDLTESHNEKKFYEAKLSSLLLNTDGLQN